MEPTQHSLRSIVFAVLRSLLCTLACTGVAGLTACGGGNLFIGPTPTPTPPHTATATATGTPTPKPAASCSDPAVAASEPLCALDARTTTCEFLIEDHCMLPYPSSVFLQSDPTTPTGFRVHYDLEAMPANTNGKHIDPTEWNTLDGFNPGPIILAFFPEGVDLVASKTAPITDFVRSLDTDSPTVLIKATTGEHIPHFVEVDAPLGLSRLRRHAQQKRTATKRSAPPPSMHTWTLRRSSNRAADHSHQDRLRH